MNKENYTPEQRNFIEKLDEFVMIWRSRGYHKKSEFALVCMACSEEGILKFGSEAKALERLVVLTKESKNEQDILDVFSDEIMN